jgi:8-oxo-dGTP pyrophosphatase MutT (NUDIX family)
MTLREQYTHHYCCYYRYQYNLQDGAEQPAPAALRELKEETGYIGRVTAVSPSTLSDPGLLDCRQAFVEVTVDSDRPPQPEQEDGEFISGAWHHVSLIAQNAVL